MAPLVPPDPDFRLADSAVGDAMSAAAEAFESEQQAIGRALADIHTANSGVEIDKLTAQLEQLRGDLRKAGQAAQAAAELQQRCARAAADFHKSAPTVDEVIAAWEDWQESRRVQIGAAGGPGAPEARGKAKAAQDRYSKLVKQREDAIKAYESAEDGALAAFGADVPDLGMDHDIGRSTTGVPTPKRGTPLASSPDAPQASAPAPSASSAGPSAAGEASSLPEAGSPATGAAPETSLSTAAPAAESAPAPNTSGPSPAQAAAIGALLAQQQAQQAGQQQAQQPQMAPAGAMPAMGALPPQQAKRDENPFANAPLEDALPPSLLAALTAPALPSYTPPAPVTTPSFTPAAFTPAPDPVYSGINLPGGGGLSSAPGLNPVITPPVTGTSLSGLVTDSNVTGRADGAAPRTAMSPSATHLAAGSAEQARATGTTAGGTGVGAPGMVPPMLGGPMGGGAGNGGQKRDPVTAKMTEDQIKLLGLETIGEAVPGGTIAQRKDGDAA